MEFRILGPLEVVDGDALIDIPGTKLRALLALLLLHPNQVMSTDRLVDGLWGEAPPKTAANTLQSHVSHLRNALTRKGAGENGNLVVTRFPGYLLAVDPEQIDAGRFERLAEAGRRALDDSSPDEAVIKLTDALALWRGPALADFAFEPFASSEGARLEELRLAVVADRMEAQLALGRHSDVAGELRQLVDEHPLRERLWAQLMTALYRCGRQAEALRAFSELRRVLGDELGIEPSHELQRLEEAILLQKPELDWHPPAMPVERSRPAPPVRHNLPVQLTSFVGRETELVQVGDALAGARLVSLCGPGGVGKTRLAMVAAGRVLDQHPDGVFVVELAPLSDPGLVPAQALAALGLTEESRPPLEALVDHLRERRLLLVLDNCEHLVTASANLADVLLRACPGLGILATSREPLHAAAETTITVPPLPVPETGVQNLDAVSQYDAVKLFLARARAVRTDFELSEANAVGIARVCRRLDGIPLALELAAARTRAMTPEEIADRLDDRFRLLTAGTTTGPARHQTLRAAVDWTYESLSEVERLVFNRLSAFAGTFSLEDAEAVCGAAPLTGADVLDVLLALVDKSLVLVDGQSQTTRYRMLETLRHYAAGKLTDSGEHDHVRERLLEWAISLAETAEPNLEGRDQARWLDHLETEHDNLRAALNWGMDLADVGGALRLAAALWRFWEVRGYLTEGRRWLERLLGLPGDVPPHLRAKALNSAGVLAQRQSAYDAAQALYEASLTIRRELNDRRGMAAALHGLGNLAGLQGDHGRGEKLFRESLAIGRAVDEPRVVAAALANLGWLAHERGELSSARRLLQESLDIFADLRDGHGSANALHRLGAIAQSEGDWATARSLYEESLGMQRELGERYGVVWSLSSLADVLEAEGDAEAAGRMLEAVLTLSQELGNKYCETITLTRLAERAWSATDRAGAGRLFRRAVVLAERLGDRPSLVACLHGLARLSHVEGDFDRATRLLAAARAVTPDEGDRDDEVTALREGLGEARFLTAWMSGRSMDAGEAARYAAEGLD